MQVVPSGVPAGGSPPSWSGSCRVSSCRAGAGRRLGGDGDTHSGMAAPSPSSAPHHPWAVPKAVGQRQDLTGWTCWTLGTEPPAHPRVSSDPESPLVPHHRLDVLEGQGQGQDALPRRMVTGKAGQGWMGVAAAPESLVTPRKATVPRGGKGVTEGGAGSNSQRAERRKTRKEVKGGKSPSLSQPSAQDQAQSAGSPRCPCQQCQQG